MEEEESCNDQHNCGTLFAEASEALQNCMQGKDPHEILEKLIKLSGILVMMLDEEGCQKSTSLGQKNKYFQASRFLADMKLEIMELLHRNINKIPEFTNLLDIYVKMVLCLLMQLEYHSDDEKSPKVDPAQDSSTETDGKLTFDKDRDRDSGVS